MRGVGKLVTKPCKPNTFAFSRVDDNLLRVLRENGLLLYAVPGTGGRFWPVDALAVATGRKPSIIRQWSREGKFVPAREVGGRPVWAQEDVDRLLRDGDFPAQQRA